MYLLHRYIYFYRTPFVYVRIESSTVVYGFGEGKPVKQDVYIGRVGRVVYLLGYIIRKTVFLPVVQYGIHSKILSVGRCGRITESVEVCDLLSDVMSNGRVASSSVGRFVPSIKPSDILVSEPNSSPSVRYFRFSTFLISTV